MKLAPNFLVFLSSAFLLLLQIEMAFAQPFQCDKKIAVMPPHTGDTFRGQTLVDLVIAKSKLEEYFLCPQDQFIDQLESRRVFDYFGVSNFFDADVKSLLPVQIRFIVSELKASHVMEIKINEKNDNIHVGIRKIDVDKSQIGKEALFFDIPLKETVKELPKSAPLLNTLALLTPNTTTIGFVNSSVRMTPVEGVEESKTTSKGLLPPLISSIGFDKIEHFRSFNYIGVSGSLFPSSFLYYIDQETEFNDIRTATPSNERTKTAHVELFGGCMTLNAQGSLHTPIGTTYVGMGFGPCVYRNRQEDKKPIDAGTGATRIMLGHRAFISDHYYLFFEVDSITFSGTSNIYKSEYTSSREVSRSTLGIGWYLPDVERIYTNFWNEF